MKLNKFNTIITALTVATMWDLLSVAKPVDAATTRLIGLTDTNTLVSFDPSNPSNTSSLTVTGIAGNLLGIDFRPANGLLYGVTDTSGIYSIDLNTGAASQVGASPFTPALNGSSFGFDFNPTVDRIRLVSDADQNLRLNPITGAVAAVDTPLAYAGGTQNPNVVASAYTNNFAGATTTQLFDIDSNLDVLVLQNPPNAGTLNTIGSLGIDFGSTGGFDILTANGVDTAYAASGSNLYNINLSSGAATALGTVGSGGVNIIGLAATQVPEPGTVGSLIGFGALGLLSRCRRRVKSPS